MKDFIPKGTGNSRFLKSAIAPTTNWEQFRDLLIGGTAPIDLNGVNPLGVDEIGTALSKSNLLTDATASLYGKDASATPNDVLVAIKQLLDGKPKMATGKYVGTGTFGGANKNTLTFPFVPKYLRVFSSDARASATQSAGYSFEYVGDMGLSGWLPVMYYIKGEPDFFPAIAWLSRFTVTETTISWYSDVNADYQLNHDYTKYYYVAIG